MCHRFNVTAFALCKNHKETSRRGEGVWQLSGCYHHRRLRKMGQGGGGVAGGETIAILQGETNVNFPFFLELQVGSRMVLFG